MKTFRNLFVAGIVVFAVLQVIRPGIPARPASAEVQTPPEVHRILEKSCYSCHSDQRRLSWFDEIVPGYWLVRHDILTARERLNFSTLGSKPSAAQKGTLYEAVNMIQLGAMPLPQFIGLHPEAKVTLEELTTLKAYLSPWSDTLPHVDSTVGAAGEIAARISLSTVPPELNGLPFDPAFEGWKLISVTDRGDNNTFRFILGNDIAYKAAQSGDISPWPDGSQLAKIAWQQALGTDGLVHPGKFVQVELMVKDARRYKDAEGWGWGRWRGLDLRPYGKDAAFVKECTGCHLPVRGNDYVYTLPISHARVKGEEVVNHAAAALPTSLPYQPLGWNAITMYVDRERQTVAVLLGNEAAVKAAGSTTAGRPEQQQYPAGAVLALVTWAQREDPHWFGARIPASPLSVEFLELRTMGEAANYRRFAGASLGEERLDPASVRSRVGFMQGLNPAQLP